MTRTLRTLALEIAAICLGIGLAAWMFPQAPAYAQNVFNDLRHEVTIRNSPGLINCSVVNSAATTLTALGGQCVAPATAGQSIYITDITASAVTAGSATADNYLELKTGQGGSCGTNTAVVWAFVNPATGGAAPNFTNPIKLPANSELCWMDAAASNKTIIVQGYVGP